MLDPATPSGETSPCLELREEILSLWRAFDTLSFDSRSRALRLGEITAVTSGAPYCPEGEIAVVLEGCLLLDDGKRGTHCGVAAAGDLIDIAGGSPGLWLSNGLVYRAPVAAFCREAGDEGVRFLLAGGVKRLKLMEARLNCAMSHGSISRVASFLLDIHRATSGFEIALSQSNIGALLSLRRSSINQACQSLRAAGALRTVRGRILLKDEAVLASMACCHYRPRSPTFAEAIAAEAA
ncbi:Crp/Fnr family transcriptional regulator [Brevundimonas vesicularis]|uniref:Crp/Fnr family transcriptional regulator n=1 Tax=Brevundimonas vesicularis TaxID=41276 RepID=UPI00384DE75F